MTDPAALPPCMYGLLFFMKLLLRSDLCDIKLYMADPTAVQMEGFGVLFIPLSANFSWMSVFVIIIATTRIMHT